MRDLNVRMACGTHGMGEIYRGCSSSLGLGMELGDFTIYFSHGPASKGTTVSSEIDRLGSDGKNDVTWAERL